MVYLKIYNNIIKHKTWEKNLTRKIINDILITRKEKALSLNSVYSL